MAGFFSPGLGFSSTIGAFIGGAAKQANTNIEAAQAQADQDSKIWAAQFAKGQEQYEREKKDYAKKSAVYNTFLNAANGNAKAADTAMMAWESDPKQFGQIYNDIPKLVQSVGSADNYQSQYMNNAQQGVMSRYNALQNISKAGGAGNMRKYFPMPQAPEFGNNNFTPGQAISPQQQPSQQAQGNPYNPVNTNLPARISLNGNGPNAQMIDSDTGKPLNQPYQVVQPGTPLDQQISAAKPAGEPIPLDNLNTPQPATPTVPQQQSTSQPSQFTYPPYQGGQSQQVGPFSTSKGNFTPYQQYEAYQKDRQFAWEVYNANRNLAKNQTPQEAAEQKLEIQNSEKYLNDSKTGLQVRNDNINQQLQLHYDVNSIAKILGAGFKASAVQPAYDQFNRFTEAMFGLSLAQMGVSNNVTDVNTLQKNVANGIINRLSQLHFGRITNKEVDYVNSGFVNPKNDPETNMRIALSLNYFINHAINDTAAEYNAVYGPNAPKHMLGPDGAVAAGRAAQLAARNAFIKEGNPWPIVANDAKAIQSVPPNTWFETGNHLYIWKQQPNGQMQLMRPGDNING